MNFNFKLILVGLFSFAVMGKPVHGGTTLGLEVSRTSGVAPLGVFFDATETLSSLTNKPFHELDYSWNFGDQRSATWAVSGKSKNSAKGPVAAHVFEKPGVYHVKLQVKDIEGSKVVQNVVITVSSAPVNGWTTYCIANTDDFDDPECSDATTIITNTFDITALISSDVRILFNRGDTFLVESTSSISNNSGPGLIGAYGSCLNPNERDICENAPLFIPSGETTAFRFANIEDWRVTDLQFSEMSVGGGNTGLKRLLHLRLKAEDSPEVAIGVSHWETLGHDQYMIFDSEFHNSYLNNGYVGSERLVLQGNIFDVARESHVLRVWQAYKAVISNNIMSSASIDNTNGRHALKLHGPRESSISTDMVGSNLANRTKYVVISDNLFGSSGPWPVAIGPQSAAYDEKVREVIFERNKLLSNYGIFNNTPISVHVNIWASNVTVRNNIFDGSETSSGYKGVFAGTRGNEGPQSGISINNNVIYTSNENNNGVTFIHSATSDNTRIANNIFYAPNDNTNVEQIEGNYEADSNIFQTDPSFVNESALDFRISIDSTARDAGILLPVFDDFAGKRRPQGGRIDIGAYEFSVAFPGLYLFQLLSTKGE